MSHSPQVDSDLAAHLPDGRDPDVAWLLVAAPADRVQPYLYAHAVVVAASEGEGWGPLTLVVVMGRAGHADVDGLATYQADRLRSGLHTTWQFSTYAQAYQAAARYDAGETV